MAKTIAYLEFEGESLVNVRYMMPQRLGSYLMVVVPALGDRWAELEWDDGLAKKTSVIR
jgi:hypothetical protein